MKVTLSPEQYERLPMRRSMKSKALTKGDIMGFLEDKGVDNVAFLKDKGTGEDVVAFQIDFQPMRLEEDCKECIEKVWSTCLGYNVKLAAEKAEASLRREAEG